MQPVSPSQLGHFQSVRDLQHYFQEHDSLRLPPGQSLEVCDVSTIVSEEDCTSSQVPGDDSLKRILSILNRMVLPLAKQISIEFSQRIAADQKGTLSYAIRNPFSLCYSHGMTLQATKRDIYTRLTDLFDAMIFSSIETVEFAPGQQLVVMGVSEEESELKPDVKTKVQQLFKPRIPLGFEVRCTFHNDQGTILNGEAEYWSFGRQKSITIQGCTTLSIAPSYTFSLEGFYKLIEERGGLYLPPGQTLQIKDPDILELYREYTKAPYIAEHFGEFVINQLLLPIGKSLAITQEGNAGYDLQWEDGCFNLSSQGGLILSPELGWSMTTLNYLQKVFINNHLSAIQFHPQQKLIIYDLTEEQLAQINTWITSNDHSLIINGLKRFFFQYNPVGFTWELEFHQLSAKLAVLSVAGEQKGVALHLQSDLKIGLERASAPWFALNLLNNSSPKLLEGLQAGDSEAFIYLLFKAIFYHCCDDFRHFRTDEIPTFFKEVTQNQLKELLQEKEFTDSLRSVIQDKENALELSHILRMTPEEFNKLDLTLLPIPLKALVTKIMKLVYDELPGSYFVANSLQQVNEGLCESGQLRPFLRA